MRHWLNWLGLNWLGLNRLGAILLLLAVASLAEPGWADNATPAASPAPSLSAVSPGAVSPKVDELLRLLDDPQVQSWLHDNATKAKAAPQPAAAEKSGADQMNVDASTYLSTRMTAIHQHLLGLWLALPSLPQELAVMGTAFRTELQNYSVLGIIILLAIFATLGVALERGVRHLWRPVRLWLIDFQPHSEMDRLLVVLVRLLFGLSALVMFAIGSAGVFLLLDWPPLLRQVGLSYLVAVLAFRLSLLACRFALAPGAEAFRLIPMSTEAAWFWYRRISAFVLWLAFGWATVSILRRLGLALSSRELIAYILGIGLLVIAIEASWHRPAAAPTGSDVKIEEPRRRLLHFGHRAMTWLLTCYFILLWLLWVATAFPSLWTLVIVCALPLSIRLANRAVRHLLRPFDEEAPATATTETRSVAAVCLDRGLRTVLIAAAALLLAKAWQIDFVALAAQDTVLTRLARGVVNAVVILLVGDLIWHIAKTAIDRKMLAAATSATTTSDEEIRRHQRLRTLLPILRNILFIVLLVMVSLMALSAMGVEIGPLIAGAGVIGVAIGFGAQTLVKDVISGMFYLLDDAFRIGEYIQSGSYKGTVESFSLRSVKLRHQRGPLYTVPFGILGAVQNMSRDWVIDKLNISVTYDTDLEKVRKLIKEIGQKLAADPEYAKHIMEPLKMQGVEQFGDFAIEIRMKMMTKPGEQFVIRRKAYALIKQAFDANGIKFATPTVQVAGGSDVAAVAAHQAMAAKAQPADL